jgi:signal peptide peptidase SppA
MRLPRLHQKIYCEPWFITPAGYRAVRSVFETKLLRAKCKENGEDDDYSMFVNTREPMEIDANGIATISIVGTLGKGLSKIEKCCGATDYEDIEDDIEAAVSANVRGIFFDIDSPGGQCTGNGEVADMIQGLRGRIPMVAYTDDMMCSAAYNIGVSCDYVFASQSATVGSIGTIVPFVDESGMWEMEGLKFDPVTNEAGDLKATMMGPTIGSEAQRAYLKQYVEDAFALFKGNVLRNRVVADDAMRGQAFMAPRALEANLIDGILTEESAYNKLVTLIS